MKNMDIQQLLKAERRPGRWGIVLGIVGALALAATGYFFVRADQDSALPRYETSPLERGRLTVTVSATGKLQPTNQVDVGSELSGIIETVMVDENDRVKKGQVLACLDTSKLVDQIKRSRATLLSAEASVRQAEATQAEAKAQLARLRELSRLSGGKVPSHAEMEAAEANALRAEANLAASQAAVAQARAGLSTDETNLDKASIRSPINGVVLTRKVEPGQTVAASLQAPVLFTLAEDLRRMELQVNVDEADVGQVHRGQDARFSVDAWPGRKYPAHIARVSFGSQVTEGVVTYPTLLQVDNDDLSLRPGMTATAEITTAIREDALLLPNAALRFRPQANKKARKDSGGILAALLPRPPRGSSERAANRGNGKPGEKQVWVLKEGGAVAVTIRTGLSDGRQTELLAGDLRPGMQVITDTLAAPK